MIKKISLNTSRRCEMIDITSRIEKEIEDLEEGIVTVFISHTTAGIAINENADPDVIRDILWKLEKLVPENENYHHAEGNSDSHMKTLLTGNSVQVIVKEGKLLLGTWQSIFFCEYDGPRERKILIHF